MNNNDVLRRIRYAYDFDDSTMISIFGAVDCEVTRAEVSDWLKKDDDPAFQKIKDVQLSQFLDGFINTRRGKKEGVQPKPETRLTRNIILTKLKIALDFKAEDVLDVLALAGLLISKHELSAFFRKPGHKHYRECHDQVLRNFLEGLQLQHRSQQMQTPKES